MNSYNAIYLLGLVFTCSTVCWWFDREIIVDTGNSFSHLSLSFYGHLLLNCLISRPLCGFQFLLFETCCHEHSYPCKLVLIGSTPGSEVAELLAMCIFRLTRHFQIVSHDSCIHSIPSSLPPCCHILANICFYCFLTYHVEISLCFYFVFSSFLIRLSILSIFVSYFFFPTKCYPLMNFQWFPFWSCINFAYFSPLLCHFNVGDHWGSVLCSLLSVSPWLHVQYHLFPGLQLLLSHTICLQITSL